MAINSYLFDKYFVEIYSVDRYFERLVPMMRSPLLEYSIEKWRHDFSKFPEEYPEQKLPEFAGSIAEGLYVCSKTPDVDCMFTDIFDELKLSPPCLKYLDNKPGFTWYTVDDTEKHKLTEALGEEVLSVVEEGGKTFTCVNPEKLWRSENMKNLHRKAMLKYTNNTNLSDGNVDIHGPAYSYECSDISLQDVFTIKHEIDYVFALQVNEWPSFITEDWLTRDFTSWPSTEIAKKVMSNYFHVVPKSSANGNSNLEWRISFSMAEKTLCQNLTEPQKICFKFFKFLALEEFNTAKVLCSYCLKTTFFWTLHEVPPTKTWDFTTIGSRLVDLFEHLTKYLKVGHMPNFFIPLMNILEGVSTENLDIVLKDTLICRNKIFDYCNPHTVDRNIIRRSWIEIYRDGLSVKFTENGANIYYTQENNKEKSWKYFTYVLWIRYLRKMHDRRDDIPLIQQKLGEDLDIKYLQDCCDKCSYSRDDKIYGAYGLLKYVIMENRMESLILYRQEINDIDEIEFDLVMGTLRFEWDVYKILG